MKPENWQAYSFALRCNGLVFKDGSWQKDYSTSADIEEQLVPTRVAFYGPNSLDNFFSAERSGRRTQDALSQPAVFSAIRRHKEASPSHAARIAYYIGGLTRTSSSTLTDKEFGKRVRYTADTSILGDEEGAEAAVAAMARYILSGGSLERNQEFTRNVYFMAEAVDRDPVKPTETVDLGLSQLARLRHFDTRVLDQEHQPFPDLDQHLKAFAHFPTVGAEFHLPLDTTSTSPDLWQRLMLLNMSQYQRGSSIQFSRNDQGIIDVRMNPSVYPVTHSNWNYIRKLLPEINKAPFTITLNRNDFDKEFSWDGREDEKLLRQLQALGMLSYATVFDKIPQTTKRLGELRFGGVYLGQTVKPHQGEYKFTGNWSRVNNGEGEYGQFGIYTGHGENFPFLSFYLSMALAKPTILDKLPETVFSTAQNLRTALLFRPDYITRVFGDLYYQIITDPYLRNIQKAGNRIVELLDP